MHLLQNCYFPLSTFYQRSRFFCTRFHRVTHDHDPSPLFFFFFFINSPSITCCFFRIVFANHTRSTRILGLDSPFDLQFSQSKEIKPAIIVPEYTHNRSICDRLKDLNVEYDSLRIWSIFIETFTLNLLFSKNNLDIDAF